MPILWVGIDFLEFRAKFAVLWAREGPLDVVPRFVLSLWGTSDWVLRALSEVSRFGFDFGAFTPIWWVCLEVFR